MTRTWTRTGTLALGALVLFTGPTAALASGPGPAPGAVHTAPSGPPPPARQAGPTAANVVEIALPDGTPGRRLPVTA